MSYNLMSIKQVILADNPTHYWPMDHTIAGYQPEYFTTNTATAPLAILGGSITQGNPCPSTPNSVFFNETYFTGDGGTRLLHPISVPIRSVYPADTGVSFEFWYRQPALVAAEQFIFSAADSYASDLLPTVGNFSITAAGILKAWHQTTGPSLYLLRATTTTPTINQWHHVALTLSASNGSYSIGKLYLNGVVQGATFTVTAEELRITEIAAPFIGNIAHIAVYDRELTADDLAVRRSSSIFGPPPMPALPPTTVVTGIATDADQMFGLPLAVASDAHLVWATGETTATGRKIHTRHGLGSDPEALSTTDVTVNAAFQSGLHFALSPDGKRLIDFQDEHAGTSTVARLYDTIAGTRSQLSQITVDTSAILGKQPYRNVVWTQAPLTYPYDAVSRNAYIAYNDIDNTTGFIDVLNPTTLSTITTIALGAVIGTICISNDGSLLYANDTGGTVYKINTTTNTVVSTGTITGTVNPGGIAVSPDGAQLYLIDAINGVTPGKVYILDAVSLATEATLTVEYSPTALVVSPDSTTAYVLNFAGPEYADTGYGSMSVIDCVGQTVVNTIVIEGAPSLIQQTLDGSTLFIHTNGGPGGGVSNAIHVFDTFSSTIVHTIYRPTIDIHMFSSGVQDRTGTKLYSWMQGTYTWVLSNPTIGYGARVMCIDFENATEPVISLGPPLEAATEGNVWAHLRLTQSGMIVGVMASGQMVTVNPDTLEITRLVTTRDPDNNNRQLVTTPATMAADPITTTKIVVGCPADATVTSSALIPTGTAPVGSVRAFTHTIATDAIVQTQVILPPDDVVGFGTNVVVAGDYLFITPFRPQSKIFVYQLVAGTYTHMQTITSRDLGFGPAVSYRLPSIFPSAANCTLPVTLWSTPVAPEAGYITIKYVRATGEVYILQQTAFAAFGEHPVLDESQAPEPGELVTSRVHRLVLVGGEWIAQDHFGADLNPTVVDKSLSEAVSYSSSGLRLTTLTQLGQYAENHTLASIEHFDITPSGLEATVSSAYALVRYTRASVGSTWVRDDSPVHIGVGAGAVRPVVYYVPTSSSSDQFVVDARYGRHFASPINTGRVAISRSLFDAMPSPPWFDPEEPPLFSEEVTYNDLAPAPVLNSTPAGAYTAPQLAAVSYETLVEADGVNRLFLHNGLNVAGEMSGVADIFHADYMTSRSSGTVDTLVTSPLTAISRYRSLVLSDDIGKQDRYDTAGLFTAIPTGSASAYDQTILPVLPAGEYGFSPAANRQVYASVLDAVSSNVRSDIARTTTQRSASIELWYYPTETVSTEAVTSRIILQIKPGENVTYKSIATMIGIAPKFVDLDGTSTSKWLPFVRTRHTDVTFNRYGYREAISSVALIPNTWNHIVVTTSDRFATVDMYVNKQHAASIHAPATHRSDASLLGDLGMMESSYNVVGAFQLGGPMSLAQPWQYWAAGYVDAFATYYKKLTHAQIVSHYDKGATLVRTSLSEVTDVAQNIPARLEGTDSQFGSEIVGTEDTFIVAQRGSATKMWRLDEYQLDGSSWKHFNQIAIPNFAEVGEFGHAVWLSSDGLTLIATGRLNFTIATRVHVFTRALVTDVFATYHSFDVAGLASQYAVSSNSDGTRVVIATTSEWGQAQVATVTIHTRANAGAEFSTLQTIPDYDDTLTPLNTSRPYLKMSADGTTLLVPQGMYLSTYKWNGSQFAFANALYRCDLNPPVALPPPPSPDPDPGDMESFLMSGLNGPIPVHYYKFDDTGSAITDTAGSVDGVITDVTTVTFATDHSIGVGGKSLSVVDVGLSYAGQVTLDADIGPLTTSWSSAAWVYLDSSDMVNYEYRTLYCDNTGNGNVLQFDLYDWDGSIIVGVYTYDSDAYFETGVGITDRWLHVAAVHDSVTNRTMFYFDGQSAADMAANGQPNDPGIDYVWFDPSTYCDAPASIEVFCNDVYGEMWAGYVDDLAFFDEALTAEQVLAQYQYGLTRAVPYPVSPTPIDTSDLTIHPYERYISSFAPGAILRHFVMDGTTTATISTDTTGSGDVFYRSIDGVADTLQLAMPNITPDTNKKSVVWSQQTGYIDAATSTFRNTLSFTPTAAGFWIVTLVRGTFPNLEIWNDAFDTKLGGVVPTLTPFVAPCVTPGGGVSSSTAPYYMVASYHEATYAYTYLNGSIPNSPPAVCYSYPGGITTYAGTPLNIRIIPPATAGRVESLTIIDNIALIGSDFMAQLLDTLYAKVAAPFYTRATGMWIGTPADRVKSNQVWLSPDGNTMLLGRGHPYHVDLGEVGKKAEQYSWTGTYWLKTVEFTLPEPGRSGTSFGMTVSRSADNTVTVFGSPYSAMWGDRSGAVFVSQYAGSWGAAREARSPQISGSFLGTSVLARSADVIAGAPLGQTFDIALEPPIRRVHTSGVVQRLNLPAPTTTQAPEAVSTIAPTITFGSFVVPAMAAASYSNSVTVAPGTVLYVWNALVRDGDSNQPSTPTITLNSGLEGNESVGYSGVGFDAGITPSAIFGSARSYEPTPGVITIQTTSNGVLTNLRPIQSTVMIQGSSQAYSADALPYTSNTSTQSLTSGDMYIGTIRTDVKGMERPATLFGFVTVFAPSVVTSITGTVRPSLSQVTTPVTIAATHVGGGTIGTPSIFAFEVEVPATPGATYNILRFEFPVATTCSVSTWHAIHKATIV